MIPIRDDNPTMRRPWVTLVFLVLNIGVYFLLQPHNGKSVVSLPEPMSSVEVDPASSFRFLYAYAAIPCEIKRQRPLNVGEVVATAEQGDATACDVTFPDAIADDPLFPGKQPFLSVLVSMFLHGGILHLAGNMLFLWIFGNNIEDRFGRFLFLGFYLLGGVAATLAHVVVEPMSTIPVVGASGAIAAVMGAYLVLYPNAKITTVFTFFLLMVQRISAKWLLGFWFISQFFIASGSGIAWVAHVGGFVFGAAVGLIVRAITPRPATPSWS